MRAFITVAIIISISACNQSADNEKELQKRVDSLEKKISENYKPGFGEFMSSIQVHHAKLWFAGQNENWALADFEINEIKETLENVQKYQTERNESKLIGLLYPSLDSVNQAVQQKNSNLFRNSYILLTNSCNNCHKETGFGFNRVKIPDSPPFNNQNFKAEKMQ